jgi:hypothetical protein
MKAGMFGRNGRIDLWVGADGVVVNGGWTSEYDAATDRVRCPAHHGYPPSEWGARICDIDPVIERAVLRGSWLRGVGYNEMIEQHRKYERGVKD